ncbi:MAG: hypothetical protein CUN57_03910 [Phototrophicales bacterium]|nr:MAG: hypothetical protein CUN57_03910 [Phototrophicales bacterium]
MRIIELDPSASGGRTITDGDGVEKFEDLSADSNLIDFVIQPSDLLSTTQTIDIVLTSTDGSTAVEIEYYNRYFGI